MNPAESTPVTPVLRPLAQLVIKQGVGLGGLPVNQQAWALALVWAGLPWDSVNEAGINQALKAQLAGPAAFLHTDHVELRRWMVDAGWLQRDGYGRAYQRVQADALPAASQPVAQALRGLDMASWTHQLRADHAAARAARRAAWDGQPAGAAK